jgi:hypothetical protein
MKTAYVVVIAALALTIGYVAGISYGREEANRSWRVALGKVESDACRDFIRDALRSEE